jgi:hypothetical protein
MPVRTMVFRVAILVCVFLGLLGILGRASPASAQTQTAVEYYYADWNFYFVTAFPDEIAALDGGAFGGAWKRTGQTFDVWPDLTGDAVPTCRFFSVVFAPRSSHFYTPYADECASLKAGTAWQFEAIAFYVLLPDADGHCPPGTAILYRLYNNGMGGAPNHRFTTSAATFNEMQSAGWIFEGDGRTGAFACVPAGPVVPSPIAGFWGGTTGTGLMVYGIVLDDGSFYFLYIAPDSSSLKLVQGTSTAANGAFQSNFAKSFEFSAVGLDANNAAMAGSYAAQSALSGTVTLGESSDTFSTTYDNSYEQPASLPAAAGTYSGIVASTAGLQPIVLSLGTTGAISGFGAGCLFSGTVAPHGAVNVLDISISYSGATCSLGAQTVTGIAGYDDADRGIIVMAVDATRTAAFLFVGAK